MKFPNTNRIQQPLSEKFGSTVQTIDQHLEKMDYETWTRRWLISLFVLCFTLFSVVASVKLAFWIFT